MKITKITQQLNRPERYSIFIDGKFAFSLSANVLLEQKLISGQLIENQQLKSLKQLAIDDKVYSNALRYVATRPRSYWEVQVYLKRKQQSDASIQKILNKLSDIGLLDDEAFARAWVENRRLLKPSSKRRLVMELRQKHLSEPVIQKVLNASQTEDRAIIIELITKKRRLSKYRKDNLKLMQYLSRQGFSYEDIKAVLSETIDD